MSQPPPAPLPIGVLPAALPTAPAPLPSGLPLLPPGPPDTSELPGRSEILPLLSTRTSWLRSRALIPIVAVGLASILMFRLMGSMQQVEDALQLYRLIGASLLILLFYLVYLYAGETENSLRYWVVGAVTYAQCQYLYWPVYAAIFRKALAPYGEMQGGDYAFWQYCLNYFISAGLAEELLKAMPAILCLAVALKHKPDGSWLDRVALKGPLDGILMGIAAGALFTMWETLGDHGYVPLTVARSQNMTAGLWNALLLLMPRVLGDFCGHAAYSGVFCYFVGLAVNHRHHVPRLLLTGWVLTAALHGLWDAFAFARWPTEWLYLPGGAAALLLVACLVKARQLEAPRLAAAGSQSVLAVPGITLAPGIVPPRPTGLAGALSTLAGAAEAAGGVSGRTTAPGPMPQAGFAIGTGRVRYALEPNRDVPLSSLFGPDGVPDGFSADVVATGADSIALRNNGRQAWSAFRDGGAPDTIPPGAQVVVRPGLRLGLGPAGTVDVIAY